MKRLFASALVLVSLIGFEIPHKAEIPAGAYGVWQCPALGTSTPLYEGDYADWQAITDADNSALIATYSGIRMIGDHANSKVDGGVWNCNKMLVGGLAFLVTEDATYEYKCYLIAETDFNGYCWKINNQTVRPYHPHDIMCCSCANAEGSREYVAFYEFVGELP